MLQRSLTRLGLLFLLGATACSDGSGPAPILTCGAAAGFAVNLAVAQYVTIDPAPNSGCSTFPANGSAVTAEYLLVPQLATGILGQTSTYRLDGETVAAALSTAALAPPVGPGLAALSPAERFHAFLRLGDERRFWGFSPLGPATAPQVASVAAAGPPVMNELRTFMVCPNLDCSGTFTQVGARARAVKSKVAIFVDTLAPAPPNGLDSAALDSLAALFDNRLYATDTAAFGRESDIDANGVVLVLMTPVVNKLVSAAECQTSGFVAGFFLGADIDPRFQDDPRSNKGEVFYSLVADPAATVSCSHSTTSVERIVPVTFIHEFQHMISFNQHALLRSGGGEVLWLNEGFSHYAEELGGRTFSRGSAEFSRFLIGNLYNAYQYLDATSEHFLLPTEGIGSLAERGAAWLFVRYLVDRHAADTSVAQWNVLTRQLVQTSQTGAQNIATVTGLPFDSVVTRWALANWVSDLPGFTAPVPLRYDSWAFRTTYASLNAQDPNTFPKAFPLTPTSSAPNVVALTGTLRAGSGVYHRALQPPGGAGFTLLFTTAGGGLLSPGVVPRLSVIRIK